METSKEKRRRLIRKILLNRLIKNILEGKMEVIPVPKGVLYNENGGARHQYFAPLDRSSYNYGYMEIDELLAGSPNIW